jgi:hypothetical protein
MDIFPIYLSLKTTHVFVHLFKSEDNTWMFFSVYLLNPEDNTCMFFLFIYLSRKKTHGCPFFHLSNSEENTWIFFSIYLSLKTTT